MPLFLRNKINKIPTNEFYIILKVILFLFIIFLYFLFLFRSRLWGWGGIIGMATPPESPHAALMRETSLQYEDAIIPELDIYAIPSKEGKPGFLICFKLCAVFHSIKLSMQFSFASEVF